MTRKEHVPGALALVLLSVCCVRLDGAEPVGPVEKSTPGRHYYVNPDTGDDAANGLSAIRSAADGPLRSIAKAIALAKAGDTVDLAPRAKPYRESAVFHNRSGEPGRPITLDGHGATLSGCEPIVPADWEPVAPGLYRNARLLHTSPSVVGRYFFRFDGRMNHMGRTSKGNSLPWKKPQDLRPGEWTFQASDKAFYLKIDPARRLDDCRIEAPLRSNGVAIGGHCEHLVIRDVNATHVWNDGYNIHGTTRDILFENISAVECGDDGLSAHDDCEVRVEGFVSIANSTGLCNVNRSTSQNNRLWIERNLGVDFYLLGDNVHTLTNSMILTSGSQSIVVAGGPKIATKTSQGDEVCTLKIDNVIVRCQGEANVMSFAANSVVEIRRATVAGLGILASGRSLAIHQSIVAGGPTAEIVVLPGTKWQAEQNLYDLKSLRFTNSLDTAAAFDQYRQATGQDRHSQWVAVRFREPFNGSLASPSVPPGVGADRSRIPQRHR